jgi:NADPH:quinone reductase-like Zn-dependent oxidoreductase
MLILMGVVASSGPTMKAIVALEGKCTAVEALKPKPAANEVLIKVYATALNRADTLQRKGKYPPPPGVYQSESDHF